MQTNASHRLPMTRCPRARRAASCLAILLLGSAEVRAQTGPVVEILEPANGATLTRMPLDVELRVRSDADPQSVAVWLNGVDVSDRFSVDPPVGSYHRVWAADVWDPAQVLDGANTLQAEVLLGGLPQGDLIGFSTEGDPYADAVDSYVIGDSGGFNEAFLPDVVLGPPTGSGLYGGTLGAFSLGLNGEIVMAFTDNVIVDGPGDDFTVFENPFFSTNGFDVLETLFSEAGRVSVSQDGVSWLPFPCANTPTDNPYYPGCAGVYPVLANGDAADPHPSVPTLAPPIESFIGQQQQNVPIPEGSGGDSFDLADVGLAWARYVRIESADHVLGAPTGPDNAGFDLDAIAAVNSLPPQLVPEPGTSLSLAAGATLLSALARRRRAARAHSPQASSAALPGSGTATRSSSAK
jgi:hypothetical protein